MGICAVCFAVYASADTVQVTSISNTHGETIHLLENGADKSTFAGEASILLNGATQRTAYCVAIFVDIKLGTTYYTSLADISTVNNGARVAWLLDNEAPNVTTPYQGAGLQMAIWDIVNDNGDGFNAGGVRSDAQTDSRALASAVFYENESAGKSAGAWVYYNTDMTTGNPAQTLMGFRVYNDGGPTVPEPGTFALTAIVLPVGAILVRRYVHPALRRA